MKILLVEDDLAIAKIISWGLRNERLNVDHAPNAVTAIKMAVSNTYDLIILDLLLPDRSGADVCKQLRNANFTTPIIILTALGDLENKIKLFDLGADDYITKPFEFKELMARIKSLMRKQKVELGNVLAYDDIQLDLKRHEAKRKGQTLELRQKEIRILEYLLRHPEQVLTREMILNYVWGPTVERHTNVVDVHIHHLREKIDKPYGTRLLKTVSNVGYKISK